MESIIDNGLITPTTENQNEITYGGFWIRAGALILDGLIMGVVVLSLMYFNVTQWKSVPLLIVLSLLGFAYKPFCEFKYGATIGKMACDLVVVNYEFQKANLTEILLRNIFGIAVGIISLIFTITMYNSPEFQEVTGFMEYSVLLSQMKELNWINYFNYGIFIVEIILLLSDKQKRSLHDRIGNTYVIVKRR
jgi:uncharacterized RDD family membrane protein YckC